MKIGEDPYPVLPSSISTSAQEDYLITLNPRTPDIEGKAWMYDVTVTSSLDGNKPLNLTLNINYAGIQHTQQSNSLSIFTISRPLISSQDGFNIIMWISIILSPFIILILLGGLYYMSQTNPFGYITDEVGNVLVDFGNLTRNSSDKTFRISSVKGDDIGLLEMSGINFKFTGTQVTIENSRGAPTVRLNNNPLIEKKILQDNDWIGSYGKLFSFKLTV